jgi:hypothetical protein
MASESADRTYAVTWRGSDGEIVTCKNLSPRVAFARLWAAWKGSGSITVLNVEPEWLIDPSLQTDDWPYSIDPPDCSDGMCILNDVTGFKCDACTLWAEENAALLY